MSYTRIPFGVARVNKRKKLAKKRKIKKKQVKDPSEIDPSETNKR